MDLALDLMVGSTRSQDVAAAMRTNEYRRIALERRSLDDDASTEGVRSTWTRLTRALVRRRTHRYGDPVAQPGRP